MISSCANPPCYDVLVEPGYYFCDLIFTGLQEMPRLGKDTFSTGFDLVPGGNFHVVRALHRLGVRVGWPCDFGSDIFSRFVLEAASKEGIDTQLFRVHDRPLRSLSVSLSFAHDRAFVSYMDGFPPTPLPELIKELQPRFVLLMGIDTGDEIRAVGAAARQVGAMVVIDPQWHERCWDEPEVRDALQWADFFLPNQSEACQLTDQELIDAALDMLVDLVPRVVIKLGHDGAAAQFGVERVHVPAIPKLPVFDTTGAGDCFDAGFLYGLLRGASLSTCLQYGNICGGLSVTGLGSEAAPTEIQLQEHLRAYYP